MLQETSSVCENQLYLFHWQQIFRKWNLKYNAIAIWILPNIWNYLGINLTKGVCKLFTVKALSIAENNQRRPQCFKMKKKQTNQQRYYDILI